MVLKEEASNETMKTENVKAGRGGCDRCDFEWGYLPLSAVKAPRHRPSNPTP